MGKLELLARVQASVKFQAERAQKEDTRATDVIDVTVLDIIPTNKTVVMNGVETRTMRFRTKEAGTQFIPELWIANMVTSFGDGVRAKMYIQENNYKAKDGTPVEGFNCTRLQLEVLSAAHEMAIKSLPKGTALQLAI